MAVWLHSAFAVMISDRIENMLIKFAGNNKLEERQACWRTLLEFKMIFTNWQNCLRGCMSIRKNVDRCLKIGVISYINTE